MKTLVVHKRPCWTSVLALVYMRVAAADTPLSHMSKCCAHLCVCLCVSVSVYASPVLRCNKRVILDLPHSSVRGEEELHRLLCECRRLTSF